MSIEPSTASTSASAMENNYRYDVFLSFRGEDVRKNFVDHLYTALVEKGIITFKDDEELEKGKRIDELFKSIEESRFYIIVFSTNYGSSSWCLNELVKIMECQRMTGHIAYPVFYDVEPTEVRKQNEAFGVAFAKQNDREEVGIWRKALEEASHLIGWDVREKEDGHEARVIKRIVEEISLKLRPIGTSVDEDIIGMEPRVKKLESSLAIGLDDVRMIAIKGIGGGGKTTLAGVVYDKVSIHFEGMCFVGNVRERSKASGLESLQKAILSDVLNEKDINISSVHDGKNMMQKKLRGKKVLLVLDDVDHLSQLEALAGAPDWFKSGSRIIITTREEQVLARRVNWIHDVSLLSDVEAINLFSRYAFGTNIPSQGYEELSQEVIRYAAGLPLTIKVLGSSLCGKDKPIWIDKLKRLEKIPCNDTLRVLELSYNGLEDDHKEIFLDIACFLKGKREEKAIRILESCEFNAIYGLDVLVQKSLVTISNKRLGMHDRIQEMGINIVRRLHPDEPNKHSRLWIQKDVEDILAKDLGTEATKAIAFYRPYLSLLEVSPFCYLNGFGKMKKLRFLRIKAPLFDCTDFFENLPDALRYLSWKVYPWRSLPNLFQANNLVALEMPYCKIVQLWEGGERKVLNKLRFLNLRCAEELESLDLETIPNLERLDLERCHSLVKLHAPDGCLKRLVYLRLSYCNIDSFSFIKHLESLEVLDLRVVEHLQKLSDIIPGHSNSKLLELRLICINIAQVPSSIENLQKLVHLHVSYCKNLTSLPRSICGLRDLRTLEVSFCDVNKLPEDLGHLECLETLDLSSTHIKRLPDSICKLKQLKNLYLSYCGFLWKLPKDLGMLECLEELNLSRCQGIEDIPDSICKLKRLKSLDVSHCFRLWKLPEDLGQLECLEKLDIDGTCMSHLPQSISLLKDLKIHARISVLQSFGFASAWEGKG